MSEATSHPDQAQRRRWLRFALPRCPFCGSERLRTEHTETRTTGQRVRHSRCRACGEKIYLVVE